MFKEEYQSNVVNLFVRVLIQVLWANADTYHLFPVTKPDDEVIISWEDCCIHCQGRIQGAVDTGAQRAAGPHTARAARCRGGFGRGGEHPPVCQKIFILHVLIDPFSHTLRVMKAEKQFWTETDLLVTFSIFIKAIY